MSRVFKDVDSIELGDDFVAAITAAVESCAVLLAVIGVRWLEATDEYGQRRLDDPEDFVRLEIEAALERGVRVIPVLVEGARMPGSVQLPASLAKLARRQALELSPARFGSDLEKLLRVLDKILAEAPAPVEGWRSADASRPIPGTSTVAEHQAEGRQKAAESAAQEHDSVSRDAPSPISKDRPDEAAPYKILAEAPAPVEGWRSADARRPIPGTSTVAEHQAEGRQKAAESAAQEHDSVSRDAPSPISKGRPDGAAPYVTPLVQRLAEEHNVDLKSIRGTGVGGRIRKQDVLGAVPARENQGKSR